jgi:hypothetical protein
LAWCTASKATKALNANLALERVREKPCHFWKVSTNQTFWFSAFGGSGLGLIRIYDGFNRRFYFLTV